MKRYDNLIPIAFISQNIKNNNYAYITSAPTHNVNAVVVQPFNGEQQLQPLFFENFKLAKIWLKDNSYNFIIDGSLSEKIKEYRTIYRYNQSELAQQIRVETTTIARWEQGKTQPTINNIKALATFFDCDITELI